MALFDLYVSLGVEVLLNIYNWKFLKIGVSGIVFFQEKIKNSR